MSIYERVKTVIEEAETGNSKIVEEENVQIQAEPAHLGGIRIRVIYDRNACGMPDTLREQDERLLEQIERETGSEITLERVRGNPIYTGTT